MEAPSPPQATAADFFGDLSSASSALLKEEKLALFLDIDNTILHAIVSYDIPYSLFTNTSTKDMFVFQMETPKPEHGRRDPSPERSRPPPPADRDQLVINIDAIKPPPKSHHMTAIHGLPTRLEHSSDMLRNSASSAISAPYSDSETTLADDSTSSDDSDPTQSVASSSRGLPSGGSRSGSTDFYSDTGSNSSGTSRKDSVRLGDIIRTTQARSRTPNVEIFDESEAQDFAGKPLYCLVKPRPGIISFLRSARTFFRIYICTFGSLEYASEIRTRFNALVAKGDKTPLPPALEPQIIAREAHRRTVTGLADVQTCAGTETENIKADLLSPVSPPATPSPRPFIPSADNSLPADSDPPITVVQQADAGTDAQAQQPPLAQTLRKSLNTILGSLKMDIDERLCVCLDDRLDVWAPEDVDRSVLKIHPYSFFFSHPIYELQAAEHGLHNHFFAAPPKLNLDLSSLNDECLRASWMTLSTIHRKFYARLNAYRTPPTLINQYLSHPSVPSVAETSVGTSPTPQNMLTPERRIPQFDVLPRSLLPSVQAYLASFRLPILRGVVIAHQGKLVRDILHLATYFGAHVLDTFDSTATHFLVSSIDSETCRQVRERAKTDPTFGQQVQVVTCSWITDCARDCRRVPEPPYLLSLRYR